MEQENALNLIYSKLDDSTRPHFLLIGDSGTGKSTIALAVCSFRLTLFVLREIVLFRHKKNAPQTMIVE